MRQLAVLAVGFIVDEECVRDHMSKHTPQTDRLFQYLLPGLALSLGLRDKGEQDFEQARASMHYSGSLCLS